MQQTGRIVLARHEEKGFGVRYADVGGMSVAYEVVGCGPRIVLTPGGRYPMDIGGLPELAVSLADLGFSVMRWDRPNCGHSDIAFTHESESALWAETLAGLLTVTGFGPAVLVGGSAGSRVAMMTAARHPQLVSGLYLLWISGGTFALMNLGVHYVADCMLVATRAGMPGVARMRTWREAITNKPANRDVILAQDTAQFLATMQSWIDHFIPRPESPVPGMEPDDFGRLTMPVTILRSGTADLHHPPQTAEDVHELIPHSRLLDPPWGEHEWNERGDDILKGGSPFTSWPGMAAGIAEFVRSLDERVGSS